MRNVHRAIALALLSGIACSPLLGLDDLYERPAAPPDAAGEAGGPTCNSNAQCMDEAGSGAPVFCVDKKCVPLDLELCLPEVRPSMDRIRNDNVALVASFLPITGSGPLGQPPALAYALALKEIDTAGGLPGGRDVAMVFCASEPDKVDQAVRHVVQDLHVPAMIASFSTGDITRFVDLYAKPNKVFMLNPNVTAEPLRYADNGRLLWNLLGTPEDVALAYRPLLERTEKFLHGSSGPFHVDVGEPLRVALVATDTSLEHSVDTILRLGPIDRSGSTTEQRIVDAGIVFNGKPAEKNGSNFTYQQIPAVENAEKTGNTPNYDVLAETLANAKPHVVIAVTAEEIKELVPRLEARLEDAGAQAPMWLLAPRNPRFAVEHVAVGYDERRKRFLGIQYASAADTAQKKEWLGRMKIAYPSVEQAKYEASENFYDAVYWLAYGLVAAGPGAPTSGESIRDGVRRLLSGPPVHPGEMDSISEAFRLITLGEVTFEGTLGPPDFDAPNGTWKSVGSVYCYANEGGGVAPRYDVLRYNRATGSLDPVTDVSPCFTGF